MSDTKQEESQSNEDENNLENVNLSFAGMTEDKVHLPPLDSEWHNICTSNNVHGQFKIVGEDITVRKCVIFEKKACVQGAYSVEFLAKQILSETTSWDKKGTL